LEQYHGTTILSVRRNGAVVIGGDGQVSLGNTIMKGNARKVRRLYHNKVLAGFAGGTADAFTLFAARALMENTELDARAVCEKALTIAADICVYTNHCFTIEELEAESE
jgi:ATP-dependent protease HslVU (ClpYQ) peptidase subunit